MVILEADNRVLLNSQRYSYTKDNYTSGVSSIFVMNTEGLTDTTKFILIGNIGSEAAEIFKIGSANTTTGEIQLQDATGAVAYTKYGHPESSRITALPYNQVGFFHTTTTTFSDTNPISGFISIQPSEWFSTYEDETYSDGYGWFVFYNSVQAIASQPSNPIPYIGFAGETVQTVLDDFFSMLSNKELRLIDRADALSWLNESYALVRTKLNVSNREYTASDEQSIAVTSGVSEYDLPTDFSKLVYLRQSGQVITGEGKVIDLISLRDAPDYVGIDVKYYLRGPKIGFLPTPSASATYYYRYLPKSSRLTLNSDTIDLPDNGVYMIKDFMMYRANMKLQNPSLANIYLSGFKDAINQMIASAVDRDGHLDSIGMVPEVNT